MLLLLDLKYLLLQLTKLLELALDLGLALSVGLLLLAVEGADRRPQETL
jgi:hypothetical protein